MKRWPIMRVRKGKKDQAWSLCEGRTPGEALATAYRLLEQSMSVHLPGDETFNRPWLTVKLERGEKWDD